MQDMGIPNRALAGVVGVLVEPFVQSIHAMTAKTPSADPQGPHVNVILSDGTHATLDRQTGTVVGR